MYDCQLTCVWQETPRVVKSGIYTLIPALFSSEACAFPDNTLIWCPNSTITAQGRIITFRMCRPLAVNTLDCEYRSCPDPLARSCDNDQLPSFRPKRPPWGWRASWIYSHAMKTMGGSPSRSWPQLILWLVWMQPAVGSLQNDFYKLICACGLDLNSVNAYFKHCAHNQVCTFDCLGLNWMSGQF